MRGAVLCDLAVIEFCWLFVACASAAFSLSGKRLIDTAHLNEWCAFGMVFGPLTTLLGYSEGLYVEGIFREHPKRIWILGKVVAWSALICCAAGLLSGDNVPSLPGLVAGSLLNFAGLAGWRRSRERRYREDDRQQPSNVLIVGAGPTGRKLAQYLRQHPEQGRVVRGFLDDESPPGFGVLGPVSDLARIARAEFADEIVIASPGDGVLARRVASEARIQHLDVLLVPDLPEQTPESCWLEHWAGVPVLTMHRESLPAGALLLKRSVDAICAALGLLCVLPGLLLIAAWIRLDSPGPALYAAPRVGRKGRRFLCYKFRTMVADADQIRHQLRAINEREGPCFKLRDDPRVTRLGHFLRRYSLDELPQLWNVVRGEMSLVGPRPHPVDDCARYDLDHLRRLDVTPGMTGLWQISARQSASFQTNLELDLKYIDNWSLGLDLHILCKTFAAVIRGTGT